MAPIDRDALITELRRQAEVAAMAGASAPTITPGQALANLADSLAGGWLAPDEDVMAGAIDRLREHLGGAFSREVSLALNEAYRNGMRQAAEPIEVRVHVPGVPYESADGTTGACDWPASVCLNRDPHSKGATYALPEHFATLVQPPAEVRVQIPGLDEPTSTDGTWIAYRGTVGGNTTYRVEGDPNGLAVGRFKASLRRFLGVA